MAFIERLTTLQLDPIPPPLPGARGRSSRLPLNHPLLSGPTVQRDAEKHLSEILKLTDLDARTAKESGDAANETDVDQNAPKKAPSVPLAMTLAAVSMAVGVVRRHPTTIRTVGPVFIRLSRQVAAAKEAAGVAGPEVIFNPDTPITDDAPQKPTTSSGIGALAVSLRLALIHLLRVTSGPGSALDPWRGRLAEALAKIGFPADAQREARAAARRAGRAVAMKAREDEETQQAIADQNQAKVAAEEAEAEAKARSVSEEDIVAEANALFDNLANAIQLAGRDRGLLTLHRTNPSPAALAVLVLDRVRLLPPAPWSGPPGQPPGLVGLIHAMGLAAPGAGSQPPPPPGGAARGTTSAAAAAETTAATAAVDLSVPRAPRPAVTVPRFQGNTLSVTAASKMCTGSILRVLGADAAGAAGGSLARGRRILLAKLAARAWSRDAAAGQTQINSLLAHMIARSNGHTGSQERDPGVDLALRWLYEIAVESVHWTPHITDQEDDVDKEGHVSKEKEKKERPSHRGLATGAYLQAWTSLLDACLAGLVGRAVRAIHRVLVESPFLPPKETAAWMTRAVEAGAETGWAAVLLLAAREVLLVKPATRSWVLPWVLDQATGTDASTREKAAKLVVNRIWSETALKTLVQDAVVARLHDAMLLKHTKEESDVPDGGGGEEGGEETKRRKGATDTTAGAGAAEASDPPGKSGHEAAIERAAHAASLYVVLASRAPTLVAGLFRAYPHLPAPVQKAVLLDAPSLAQALGAGSGHFLAAIDNLPAGTEPVALRMIHALTETAPPSDLLLALLQRLGTKGRRGPGPSGWSGPERGAVIGDGDHPHPHYEDQIDHKHHGHALAPSQGPDNSSSTMVMIPPDARFLALALPYLSRPVATSHVASVVGSGLPIGDLRMLANRLCRPSPVAWGRTNTEHEPRVHPATFLVELHASAKADKKTNHDPEANEANVKEREKSTVEALTRCLKDPVLRRVFDRESVVAAIQQMLMGATLPKLFMRTVILALQTDAQLLGLTMTVLETLIARRVWEDPVQWRGFVLCCAHTSPRSMKFLLALPPARMTEAIGEVAPRLADPLLAHIKGIKPAPNRAVIDAVVAGHKMAVAKIKAATAAAAAAAAATAQAPKEDRQQQPAADGAHKDLRDLKHQKTTVPTATATATVPGSALGKRGAAGAAPGVPAAKRGARPNVEVPEAPEELQGAVEKAGMVLDWDEETEDEEG